MNRYNRLVSNTALFTAGKFLSKIIVFLMMRLYTSCLTTAQYGTADLISNTANLLIPIACLGIGEGIFRSTAAKLEDREVFFTNGLAILLYGTLGFLVLSPLLGFIKFFTSYVWLIILYVVVSNIHAVCSQYLCACGYTKLFAGQGLLNTALTVLLNLLFLPVLDMGVTGYVLSVILADFLTTVFLVVYAKLWRSIKISALRPNVMRSMLKFCLPLIPTTVFWWVTSVSDRYLVAFLASPESNGLYAAAYKIPTLLIYAVSIFDGAWKLSAISDSEDEVAQTAFFSRVWRMYTTLGFVGGAILILLCKPFAGILFAEDYSSAWVYIPVLCVATVFTALDTFLGSVYYTCGKTVYSLRTAFVGAALNIVLNIWWIPIWGAMGASIATFISYFVVFVVRLATITKLIPFRQERLRAGVNTVLICVLAVCMTFTGGHYSGFWWFGAILSFAAVVLWNISDVMRLVGGVLGMAKKMLKRN
ncbi:MAG: hypothetical protein E7589_05665 [Ruminococcaceae bacterium]|nr:hypothetical protein [Oscillospiraceae bacterium]